jgi:hypothetical protein
MRQKDIYEIRARLIRGLVLRLTRLLRISLRPLRVCVRPSPEWEESHAKPQRAQRGELRCLFSLLLAPYEFGWENRPVHA